MKVFILSITLVLTLSCLAQKPIEYSFDLPVVTQKKKKIEQLFNAWLLAHNAKMEKIENDTLWATGSIQFDNTVIYEDSKTYNRVYREQSNGNIKFNMKAYLKNKELKVSISDFKHHPKMKFDNLNFGTITNNESAPKEIEMMTNPDYSLKVWQLMKNVIKNFVEEVQANPLQMASK